MGKELLLDEVDEIVVGLFSQTEFPYWQNSPDSRLKAEFTTTVANVWVLLSCVSLSRQEIELIAFECGKALLSISDEDIRIILKQYRIFDDVSQLLVFLQNLQYLTQRYQTDRFRVEKFLSKLHETKLFETTRLDRYCENWESHEHEQLQFSLNQRWYKRAVAWLCQKEEDSKKFIAQQMNSRANTLLKDQLESRSRESFVNSNHHDDACCFEDIFYILQGVNESPHAEVSDCPISKERLVHGDNSVEDSCRKILSEIQKKKQQISHVYLLKNDVQEGVMGHWTVLCYERVHALGQWRLCEYFNPSGQGFRCGDRCIQWVLNHSHRHNYINLPQEIVSKLHVRGTEREITWDMTEITKQLSECVNVEIPTYIMKDDGDLVNLLSVGCPDEVSAEEDDLSSSDSEDFDWEYVPTAVEVLQSSFTESEINLILSKHGFDRKSSISEAIEKICTF